MVLFGWFAGVIMPLVTAAQLSNGEPG